MTTKQELIKELPAFNNDKEFRIESRVKNNLLYSHIMRDYESAADFCRNHGLSQGIVSSFLNLRRSVIAKRGKVCPYVLEIAEALRCLPEDIFPKSQWEGKLINNATSFEVAEEDAYAFISQQGGVELLEYDTESAARQKDLREAVDEALSTLTPREQRVLRQRFGIEGEEKTFKEVSKDDGIGGVERMRQIQEKALRKLKRPETSRKLRECIQS